MVGLYFVIPPVAEESLDVSTTLDMTVTCHFTDKMNCEAREYPLGGMEKP